MKKIISVILAVLLAASMAANAYLYIEHTDEKEQHALLKETSARDSASSASRIKTLESDLKTETALYEETLSALTLTEEKADELSGKLDESLAAIEALEGEKAENEKTISSLNADKETLTASLENANASIKVLEGDKAALTASLPKP